jgi:hypothetical protein
MLLTVGSELLAWLYTSAETHEKYKHAILIQNLAFFELCVNSRSASHCMSSPVLSMLLQECAERLQSAREGYLDWMISYEMPTFANLSSKIESVEKRANRDELSLYVRRYVSITVVILWSMVYLRNFEVYNTLCLYLFTMNI